MRKKVYSFKLATIFSLSSVVIFTIAEIISKVFLINNLGKKNIIFLGIFFIIGLLLFLCFSIFMANRWGCIVKYDPKNNTLIRKGLICGYKYQVKIEDIQYIGVATFPKETTYYVFVDSHNTKYEGLSKKSFIRIEKNEINLEFIKQFWDKPIKEY